MALNWFTIDETCKPLFPISEKEEDGTPITLLGALIGAVGLLLVLVTIAFLITIRKKNRQQRGGELTDQGSEPKKISSTSTCERSMSGSSGQPDILKPNKQIVYSTTKRKNSFPAIDASTPVCKSSFGFHLCLNSKIKYLFFISNVTYLRHYLLFLLT